MRIANWTYLLLARLLIVGAQLAQMRPGRVRLRLRLAGCGRGGRGWMRGTTLTLTHLDHATWWQTCAYLQGVNHLERPHNLVLLALTEGRSSSAGVVVVTVGSVVVVVRTRG